jgi:hypothetical protein
MSARPHSSGGEDLWFWCAECLMKECVEEVIGLAERLSAPLRVGGECQDDKETPHEETSARSYHGRREGLNMEIIKELRLPLPPISLQQNFATLAERHDQLRAIHVEAAGAQ